MCAYIRTTAASSDASGNLDQDKMSCFVDGGESRCPQRCCTVRPEDFEDEFDDRGVSTELLESWASLEQKALQPAAGRPRPKMSMKLRETILHFLQHLVKCAGLRLDKWFEVATLLDVYLAKSKDCNPICTLPATCAALVMLVKKNDYSIAEVIPSFFVPRAAQLTLWLEKVGLANAGSDVTEEMLLSAEEEVLEVIEWRVNLPTVESWTAMFCERVNILTQNMFQDSVAWIWQRSLGILTLILTKQSLSIDALPQMIAAGVLGLGMLSARLLPGDALRPSRISCAEWNSLCSLPEEKDLESPLGGDMARHLLNTFEAATGCTLPQVQEACLLTATAVRNALADRHAL